jgi:hypothetical protein
LILKSDVNEVALRDHKIEDFVRAQSGPEQKLHRRQH